MTEGALALPFGHSSGGGDKPASFDRNPRALARFETRLLCSTGARAESLKPLAQFVTGAAAHGGCTRLLPSLRSDRHAVDDDGRRWRCGVGGVVQGLG